MENVRKRLHVDGQTEYSWCQGHFLHLSGQARCGVLWAAENLVKPSQENRYRTPLVRLSRALKEKRPQYKERHDKIILHHDNAQPHVARPVKTYLETLKWEVFPEPPYSLDVASSDYHLFRSMAHGTANQHFCSYEEVKNHFKS